MILSKLKSQFSLNQTRNASMFVSNSILVALLAVSLFHNTTEDTVVINNLNEHCQESSITYGSMSEDNHKRLGYFLSGILGNITPATADYVPKVVLPFVSPILYKDVKNTIAIQLSDMKDDEIVMTFSAERAQFENGITYITGKGSMTGPTGITSTYIRTYEFQFNVENYTPTLTYMDVYEDKAHNNQWKEKNQAKEK